MSQSAMSNPASPIMANLVPLLKIYVDSILVIPIDQTNEILESFNAFHPRLHFTLEAVVKNLLYRSTSLCSPEFIEYYEKIKQICQINNYPPGFVNKLINECCSRSVLASESKNKDYKFNKLPFITRLFQRVAKTFVEKTIKIKFAYYNTESTRILFSQHKDKTPIEECSNLV